MQDYASVSLHSGGGGLVSTALDYARFAEVMRNGDSLNGVRILGPKTVDCMSTNHLSAGSGLAGLWEQPGVEAVDSGLGFGLGPGVVTDTTKPALSAALVSTTEVVRQARSVGLILWKSLLSTACSN